MLEIRERQRHIFLELEALGAPAEKSRMLRGAVMLTSTVETASPLATTRCGKVRGSLAGGIHAFKGVPYAAPPFGAHRLRAPQPAESWTGVRSATDNGPKPPQIAFPGTPPGGRLPWDRAAAGEDCLNLNVWTPDPGRVRLPVMVWMTGGAFHVGSAAWYDGRRFARDGVVCVSINYRVGAEGFLYLSDAVANRGLLDQIAAMEWVRDNIAAFGGDPDNVTLCGESAGAMSIGSLLAMPRAKGLFRRAILQSGAAHHVISADRARRVGELFAEKLGIEASLEAMATVPVDQMLAAQMEVEADLAAHPDPQRWGLDVVASAMPLQPVIDGDSIPGSPLELIRSGASSGVDVMVGTNVDDWRLFLAMTGALDQITERVLTGPVAEHGYQCAAAYGLPVEQALAAYRAASPTASPGDLLAAIQTDWWCRIPAIRLADAHVNDGARTFMYEFGWRSPVANGLFGSCHALEIPFVFDTLDDGPTQMVGDLLGENPPQQLANIMHSAWVSFIKRGDAGWPEYDLGRRATMTFNTISSVADDPRSRERELWEGTR
ncbi:MAG: carboxylesterase/lipase family protein [Deltaproteobacteria bacterium]|nr:carboxylesterase/lipase family protein [Deltaproteobacteria bacterium]